MRLGVDTGGTFTDFVWLDADGRLQIHKELSTPTDPSQAILQGGRCWLCRQRPLSFMAAP